LGASVTVPFTPTQLGINDLYAQSVDRAGNLGLVTDYQFFVLAGSDPVGDWALNETSGTTAADTGTGNHPATLHGTVTRTAGRIAGTSAVHFNGTDTDASTAGPVLNTAGSYTVSAWVRLPSLGGACCYTVASEDSTTNSPFLLRYNGATDRWTFSVIATDAQPTTWVEATATTAGVAGVWTHVAGVYDAGSKQAMLYLNGALAATANVPGVFAANGPFAIGRGKWAGNASAGRWRGEISDVQVWDRVVTPDEFTALSSATRVARWDLDDLSGTTASGTRPGTLSGGVGFTTPGHAQNNTGSTTFDGTNGSISAVPVLHTDQSYTVSAWAKLPSNPGTGCYAVVGQQNPSGNSAFFLRYNGNPGRWEFSVVTSASTTSPSRVDVAGPAGQSGVWVHLAGVYDAGAKQASLYVNGQKVASTAVPQTFDTSGALVMGQDEWAGSPGDFWRGGIDDVRVYQGVLPDQAIGQLAHS
jgi:hypothetical protein